MEAGEETKTREEQERQSQQRIKNLQRDLTTLVANTQIAAEANVVLQRRQRAKTQANRAELLENDSTSSQVKSDEILRRQFESIINRKDASEDLQKALQNQQELYAAIVQDKKKLINDLQQELKIQGDNYVGNLRKNAEEINVMVARMEDQIKLMTKAYREELAQIERLHRREISILLTKDMEDLERDLKKLWDEELERFMERKQKLEEYKKEIHQISQESIHFFTALDFEKCSKYLAEEREQKGQRSSNMPLQIKKTFLEEKEGILFVSLKNIKSRIVREVKEIEKLKKISTKKQNEFSRKTGGLVRDYKRLIQNYECTKNQVRHFAFADAKRFERVWLTIEAEVKQLAERALAIDSVIARQLFGLPWDEPDLGLLELSSPMRSWRPPPGLSQPVFQTKKSRRGMMEGFAECDVVSPDMALSAEGAAVSVNSCPESEEVMQSKDAQKEIRELLCNETDFLMEAKVLKLLTPLVTEEQTVVKLGSLLYTLGIDEEDLPQLTDFLLKYKQQIEQTEDMYETNASSATSMLLQPNHILPALKSFLEKRNPRMTSAQQLSKLWLAHARDSSKDAEYWENLGNIIPEEKLKLWESAERTLKQYHAVLTDISDFNPEIERLTQQNVELRIKLNSQLKK